MTRFAIFFPQYYPTSMNDMAWGYGFTDWTLLAAANAFGIWDRRAPACGFYDLSRDEDIFGSFQAASDSGLDGFGLYHYRFDEGPELDSVEKYLLRRCSTAKLSYFFIWANEDWTTRWTGGRITVLRKLSSKPSRKAVAKHVEYLLPFMESRAYARVGKRPLFIIYHPDHFAEPETTIGLYREEFIHAGVDPFVGVFVKNVSELRHSRYCDCCYLFEPRLFFNFQGIRGNSIAIRAFRKIARRMPGHLAATCSERITRLLNRQTNTYSFSEFLSYFTSGGRRRFVESAKCPVQEVVTCGWNNAPRYRQRFTKLEVPSTEEFAVMMNSLRDGPNCQDGVPLLCNAWNEWCEGAAIEPCSYLGDRLLASYLNASRSVASECSPR